MLRCTVLLCTETIPLPIAADPGWTFCPSFLCRILRLLMLVIISTTFTQVAESKNKKNAKDQALKNVLAAQDVILSSEMHPTLSFSFADAGDMSGAITPHFLEEGLYKDKESIGL